ncbi:Uncharacterized protein dnl_08320 [Desulfonema limicola]|uniref:Uncharacterized protein n=1 Tax=Desulfonema limicola TaxID=45656 RepID=A0A975B4G0_9BACT|nr:Uncharacterized protein dnl_08320 [Desulfonema limicola]
MIETQNLEHLKYNSASTGFSFSYDYFMIHISCFTNIQDLFYRG